MGSVVIRVPKASCSQGRQDLGRVSFDTVSTSTSPNLLARLVTKNPLCRLLSVARAGLLQETQRHLVDDPFAKSGERLAEREDRTQGRNVHY